MITPEQLALIDNVANAAANTGIARALVSIDSLALHYDNLKIYRAALIAELARLNARIAELETEKRNKVNDIDSWGFPR